MGFTKKQRREQKKRQFEQKFQARKASAHNTAQRAREKQNRKGVADAGRLSPAESLSSEQDTEPNLSSTCNGHASDVVARMDDEPASSNLNHQ